MLDDDDDGVSGELSFWDYLSITANETRKHIMCVCVCIRGGTTAFHIVESSEVTQMYISELNLQSIEVHLR